MKFNIKNAFNLNIFFPIPVSRGNVPSKKAP